MDTHRFDKLARMLGRPAARRRFALALAGAVGGLAAHDSRGVAAKRRKRPRVNAFGCLNVGEPCRGSDRLCCSGICQGKKPEKGRKDRSRCVAHGASTCRAGQRDADQCSGTANVVCTTSTGQTNGRCNTTTGNAPYCAAELYGEPCQTDADCQPHCGEAAACILCSGSPSGRACASPTVGLCQFPD